MRWRAVTPLQFVRRARARLSGWPGVPLAKAVAHDARDDRIGGLAAEIAFFSLLSVFPAALAVAAALGALDSILGVEVASRAQQEVVSVLSTLLTENGQGAVDAVTSLFEQGSAGLFSFGVLTSVWAASRGMAAVLRTLTDIYDTEDTRSAVRRRAIAVGLALVTMLVAAVILVMIVLGPLFGLGRAVATGLGVGAAYGALWNWLALPAAFLALLGWSAVIFHAVPHPHVGWRPHLLGAAVTGAMWIAISVGFRVYVDVAGGNQIFGILGGALVVLLWFYLIGLALLLGAEVNAVLARGTGDGRGAGTGVEAASGDGAEAAAPHRRSGESASASGAERVAR